jgi:hypothetical protein
VVFIRFILEKKRIKHEGHGVHKGEKKEGRGKKEFILVARIIYLQDERFISQRVRGEKAFIGELRDRWLNSTRFNFGEVNGD